jgi:hypothetical protein
VVLTNSGLLDEIGERDAAHTLDEAIEEARAEVGGEGEESRKQEAESRKQEPLRQPPSSLRERGPSFPRKRESMLLVAHLNMDPRVRGDDVSAFTE